MTICASICLRPLVVRAGSVASDGKHLFFAQHAPRKYYKKQFADGSLRRFIKIDITVNDLLELLVGRIPIDPSFFPVTMALDQEDRIGVRLVDRWGTTRQQIILDTKDQPQQVQWYDDHGRNTVSLTANEYHRVDGFVLPQRIVLSAVSGQTVFIQIERYEANVMLNENLFVLPPISS